MSNEKRNTLGFAAAVIAPFLLFNPEFALADVLPDIIGYLLLVSSLSRLRDVCPHLQTAYEKFQKMILISGIKLLAIFWIFGLLQLSERPTAILLFAFAFAVVELLWLVPAWNAFFEGLSYVCETTGGSAALKSAAPRRMTMIFLGVKAVFSVLPEFASMSDPLTDGGHTDWYTFIGLFRGTGIFLILITGIVWLILMTRFLIRVMRDSEFFEASARKYSLTFGSKPGARIRRSVRSVMLMICAGVLVSMDLEIACSFGTVVSAEVPVNVIPDAICGALFVVVFFMLRDFWDKWKLGAVLSGVYTLLCAAAWFVSFRFHYNYSDTQMWIRADAYEAFWKMYALRSLCNLLFLAILLLVCAAVASIIREHCGYIPETLSPEYRERKLADIRRELMRKLNICAVGAFVSVINSAAYDIIVTLPDFFGAELWWMLNIVLTLTLFGLFLSLASAVNDEVESRYMLE